ncbi:MAG: tetratricopeptide repeat protein [Planctomycetota bacterium]|jgi:tetratricopeptide (TPR) repeat protein|nr:tetratricopeptide repeat protein [Planctomycetota bacterium]
MDLSGDKRFADALVLLEERRFFEAVDAFSELVTLAPDMTGAYGNRGLAYLNLGLEEQARSDFETVIQLDPGDPMGHSMLAEIARFHGSLEDSLRHVARAIELDPSEPQAFFIRGWLFAKAGQFDMAADDLKRHLELIEDRTNTDVADFYDACRVLASDAPRDDEGEPLDTQEKRNAYLGLRGWSFDSSENGEFEEDGLPCAYAHCIRNRPPLAPEAEEGCPVFGYSCPGGEEQVSWCGEHPPVLEQSD